MKKILIPALFLLLLPWPAMAYDGPYTGAQVDAAVGAHVGRNTTVADPGSDAELVTEQAVREALDLKLDLSGGSLTGELVIDELGIEGQPTDAITDCSGFSATGGGIFYDDSEGKWKKCEDGVLTDLDTGGGATDHGALTGLTDDDHDGLYPNSAAEVVALFTTCGAAEYLMGDGDCGTPAGSGDITGVGDCTTGDCTAGIADNNVVQIDDADAADNDYAKLTATGIEGRSYAEVRTDLGLVIGTNVLAEQTIGIADNNLMEVDHAAAADNDYAKFTANGLEGRSYAEVVADLESAIEDITTFDPTGTWDLTGLTALTMGPLTFQDTNASPNAVGELQYDNTVAGLDDGAIAWYDDDEVKYLLDYVTLPTTDGQFPVYNATTDKFVHVSMSGDATMNQTGAVVIATNAVENSMMADNSVDSAEIVAGAVDAAHLAIDIINADKMANADHGDVAWSGGVASVENVSGANSVDSDAYVDGSVDATHLAADVIDESKIADNGIDSEHYNDGSIDSVHIATIVESIAWNAAGFNVDGTQCADPTAVQINSGPYHHTVICADNDSSTMYGHVIMPDSWNAGTVTFEGEYLQTAADTSALNSDVAMMCRGAGETVNNTWGTEVALDDAAVTGSNAVDHTTTAAITANGTCAAGDTLFWRWQLDATGTTTAVATLHFLGAKIEYTSNVGD